LNTATFEILTNDRLPPELPLLAECLAEFRAAQLVSSETRTLRFQFSVSRLSVHLLIEYVYKLKCIEI